MHNAEHVFQVWPTRSVAKVYASYRIALKLAQMYGVEAYALQAYASCLCTACNNDKGFALLQAAPPPKTVA